MAPTRTAALAAALFLGVSADADTRQPRLRGAAPAVTEAEVPADTDAEELWRAGHTGVRVGPCGVHVGHTGVRGGPGGAHVGHEGVTVGPCGDHIGHTGATWRRPWLLEQVGDASTSTLDPDADMDSIASSEQAFWGHVSHTSVGYRRGWGGWGRGGHIGHTSATWGHPWMLDEVNQNGDEQSEQADQKSESSVPSAAGDVADKTDSLWGHISHTSVGYRRGWGGWGRGGHIGHTSATWGHPWMLNQVQQTGDDLDNKAGEDSKASSAVDETESFWAHVSHTGATWGRRGWFGPRGGHIGHTSATWGHPWMLNEVNQTVEAEKNVTDDFWMHVGHTGATWGRYGGAGHVGHTSATWGRPWMLDEQKATANDTAANSNVNTSSAEEVFPGANDEFWLVVGPEGASVTKERPAVLSALDANETELQGADDQLEAFWAHVSHTGARWGRVGAWGPRYGHVGHTSATWGRPWR